MAAGRFARVSGGQGMDGQPQPTAEQGTTTSYLPVVMALSRKGGAGKTTLVRALASAAVAQGLRVLLIDTDTQRGLADWGVRAERAGRASPLMKILATREVDEVHAALDEAHDAVTHDLALIDTAGTGLGAMERLVVEADHLVLPMRLTASDVAVTAQTLEWVGRLAERVEDPALLPRPRVVVSDMNPRPTRNDKDILVEVVRRMPMLSNPILHRQALRDMDREGLLGPMIDAFASHPEPLMRSHAGRFREALDEASDLLAEICGPLTRRSA